MSSTCTVCLKNKTAMTCDACDCACCKHCSYIIDENVFELLSLLPERISDKAFCPNCYHDGIEEELVQNQETLEKAKEVDVYVKIQGAETRKIRRIEKPILVKDCSDRKETLLRLAFLAAQKGYSTIVDVDINSRKVGTKSYIELVWDGSAVPVNPQIRK